MSDFEIAHGSAVALGMCIVATAGVKEGICTQLDRDKVVSLCKKYDLPTKCEYSKEELYTAALSDKKRDAQEITLVCMKGFGNCELKKTSTDNLMDFIDKGMDY